MRRLAVVVCVWLTIGMIWTAWSVRAQDPAIAELYGRGVHAYYQRDYETAYRYLDALVQRGTKDPRAYYFRGLVLYATNRQQEAQEDFRKGAELEAEDVDNYYNVSRALERVQGSVRVLIEKFRHEAKLAAAERLERIARAKYRDFIENERRVLFPPPDVERRPVIPPSVEQSRPVPDEPFSAPGAVTPPQPERTPPAASQDSGRANPPSVAPAPSSPPAGAQPGATDPFAPRPSPARPATDDPFAPATPQANQPGASPPASGTSGRRSRGAVSGLFRAFRRAIPSANVPQGVIPGLPGNNGADPFGEGPKNPGGTDPFAPPRSSNPPANPTPPNNDPFAPPKNP